MDNLDAAFLMGQEFGDAQFQNQQNYFIHDPIALENMLDPITFEADFDDEFLMNDMQWMERTTPEERNYYKSDIGLVKSSLLDGLIVSRSHPHFILSYDIKRILESFEFYVRENLN